MWRINIKLAAIATALFLSVPFFVSAQTPLISGILITGNGVISSSTPMTAPDTSPSYRIKIGTGWDATTTAAYVSMWWSGSNAPQAVSLELHKFEESSYSTDDGYCHYEYTSSTAVSSPDYTQLDFSGCTGSATQKMDSSKYYEILIQYSARAGTTNVQYNGQPYNTNSKFVVTNSSDGYASTTLFSPMWALVGNGFQIFTPTASSSGLFFSGANAFCASQFSGSSLSTDLAYAGCLVGGYLFIPTGDSLSNFFSIPSTLAETPPISWFGQIKDVLSAAVASSSEDNFIDLNIAFGSSTAGLGFTSLDVISTSTISKYLSAGTRNNLKGLLSVLFYVSAASLIYWQVKGLWQTA